MASTADVGIPTSGSLNEHDLNNLIIHLKLPSALCIDNIVTLIFVCHLYICYNNGTCSLKQVIMKQPVELDNNQINELVTCDLRHVLDH